MVGIMPEYLFHFCHSFRTGMCKGVGEPCNRFFHAFKCRMQFSIQAFSSCPICIAPQSTINSQLAERRGSDFSFYSRSHYKRTNTNGEFTQSYFGTFQCNCIISGSRESNATSNAFTMHPCHNQLRTFAHGINNISKAAEKFSTLLFIFYTQQFVKRSTTAKSTGAGRTK